MGYPRKAPSNTWIIRRVPPVSPHKLGGGSHLLLNGIASINWPALGAGAITDQSEGRKYQTLRSLYIEMATASCRMGIVGDML
jgi:hypothetical protein